MYDNCPQVTHLRFSEDPRQTPEENECSIHIIRATKFAMTLNSLSFQTHLTIPLISTDFPCLSLILQSLSCAFICEHQRGREDRISVSALLATSTVYKDLFAICFPRSKGEQCPLDDFRYRYS